MIRQVVFDLGQVLVHYEPDYMTGIYIKNEEDRKTAEKVIFDRLYWDPLDAGTISDEELMKCVYSRLPERLWEQAREVYDNWYYNMPEIDGMRNIISKLKTTYGLRIFILSNIGKTFAEHASEIPILSVAEKCIFSAVCGHIKPNTDMFEYLCRECGIKPEETLFIDDNAKNVAGAEKYGIRSYRFDGDPAALERYLDGILDNNQ
ncbi:MAG: HAD family phosphatase [Clostridia bacterium]|nr:HAD family phosphatase [Clostridia bacterium]